MKKFNIKIGGTNYAVEITGVEDNVTNLTVNDIPYEIEELTPPPPKNVHRTATPTIPASAPATPASAPVSTPVSTPATPPSTPVSTPAVKPTQASSASGSGLKSPLPGVILEVKVKVGDQVKMGQTVIILEAMKMENNIDADKDGIVEKIDVNVGSSVLEGDVLLTIK